MAAEQKRSRPEKGFYFYKAVEDGIPVHCAKKMKKQTKLKSETKKFYPIEIISRDKSENKVKIHYVGHPEMYDEWRSCDELAADGALGRVLPRFVPNRESLADRSALFCDRLRRKIKQTLFSSKRDSPEIGIESEIEEDVFNHCFQHIGVVQHDRGRHVHCVDSPVDPGLTELFASKWSERILNKHGDFCYVIKGTIQFWTHKKAFLKEFAYIGDTLFENQIENELVFVFTFLRGDGVKSAYNDGQWKY